VLSGVNVIFIGGSKYSVFEDVPNLAALIAVLKDAREKRTPVLGICFGAQLLAHMYGGEVVRDNANEEFGTFEVKTTDDAIFDMLFADMPDAFPAQCAHQDKITKIPPGATLLASSARCAVQAFVIPGTDIYGFQFHPERSKSDFEKIIALRKADHSSDPSRYESALVSLKESSDAESLVAKVIDRIVAQK
jgi:GMP synthase (glutamine-hydrolysing)